jgi:outer membrane receptor for ferrienterochelin and colicins
MQGLIFLLLLQSAGTIAVQVRSESGPVEQAEIVVRGEILGVTDAQGQVTIQMPAGETELTIQRYGFTSKTLRVEPGAASVQVELEAESVLSEEIIVTATRSDVRIEDEPLRVEVVDHEEIDEKAVMTPGDIAMLLNETSGLRVQVTSPSLGAANVRVQGLRGRYTQLLSDGLPLYGGQTGSIGILQIPPLDLGQVEVIKGVASALYGSSALGGVINLVSRRPVERERQLLINRTSRGGTDTAFWLAEPPTNRWGYTLLGGGHFQERNDIDRDQWADLPAYRRGVLRPRFFWDDKKGRSFLATVGAMAEDREGGGNFFAEELRTRRLDSGAVGRFLIGNRVMSVRASAMTQSHRHQFGKTIEHDRHGTWFGEAAIGGASRGHTWALGPAIQVDRYRSEEVSRFDYTYVVPGVFAQDEYSFGSRATVSASGRLDAHSEYGAFFSPRLSALLRFPHRLTARLSTGTGVFAPTPFTEETEAVGLSKVAPLTGVRPERAWSASGDLGWTAPHLELNGTLFKSIVRHPVGIRPLLAPQAGLIEIANAGAPTRTAGSELLARVRAGEFNVILTHTFTHSTETDLGDGLRRTVPLTPRHTAGLDVMWEKDGRSRVGFEVYYTGRQELDDDPYLKEGSPYWIFGLLLERRVGPFRLFVNGEDLSNVRQTRFSPLVRPRRHFDGRWTVDAWAPIDGRVVNAGFRLSF